MPVVEAAEICPCTSDSFCTARPCCCCYSESSYISIRPQWVKADLETIIKFECAKTQQFSFEGILKRHSGCIIKNGTFKEISSTYGNSQMVKISGILSLRMKLHYVLRILMECYGSVINP
jgi:hypothetical protein